MTIAKLPLRMIISADVNILPLLMLFRRYDAGKLITYAVKTDLLLEGCFDLRYDMEDIAYLMY